MASGLKVPNIPEEERTPLVVALLEIIRFQQEQIQELRDEIARLKGQKPKPRIKPSALEKDSGNKEQKGSTSKRPGSTKREKTGELDSHETVDVPAENVPKGSTFKGYEEITVQDILFQAHNKLYRRERWLTPGGDTIIAPLPKNVTFMGGHFDAALLCFVLALCWIHAERSINKLVGFNDAQREALAGVRTQIWELYGELKAYREAPGPEKKLELLLVLNRPEIPLHNNAAETDIREYVRKRIISGSTRSDFGRRCRDTFASLKKTCRKLGVGFREYLKDRVSGRNTIPWLSDLMRQRVGEAPV
jgi:hypothetical protein